MSLPWLYAKAHRVPAVLITLCPVVALSWWWLWLVGRTWEASAVVRTFAPLIAASMIVTPIEPAFGEIEGTAVSRGWRYHLAVLGVLTVAWMGLVLLIAGTGSISLVMLRNLLGFTGLALVLALMIRASLTWVVLLPLWSLIYLFDSSRYADTWPTILWYWPLAHATNWVAWCLVITWMTLGTVAVIVHDTLAFAPFGDN